ncbi:MAG: hypothetical protein L0Y57_14775 [Beijerinckiaceae bacterium]|nr:hypothetical protein [Beijerinckiaceae bacterium]
MRILPPCGLAFEALTNALQGRHVAGIEGISEEAQCLALHGTEPELTDIGLEDFGEEIGAPSGGLALCLDASPSLAGTHKAGRETAHGGHVLGAVAAVVAQVRRRSTSPKGLAALQSFRAPA